MMSFKEPKCQMTRWLKILLQFDLKIKHRAEHGNVDSQESHASHRSVIVMMGIPS